MEEKSFDYINVIPLVDVMLVLLVIVLTGATFIASGSLPIELPKASAKQTELEVSQIIEIDAAGTVYFQDEMIEPEELTSVFRRFDRNQLTVIKADAKCSLQRFVDVFDALTLLGFNRIDLQTERKDESSI